MLGETNFFPSVSGLQAEGYQGNFWGGTCLGPYKSPLASLKTEK